MDRHHRRPQPHPGNFRLEGALVLAIVVGHIGRRAPHVEADDLFKPRSFAGLHCANNAPCRPRQNAVFPLKGAGIGQTAIGLHEHQRNSRLGHVGFRGCGFIGQVPCQLHAHLVDIASQNWRQVSIHHRGVATTDQLHQRADLVRDGNLQKADLLRQRRN